MNSQLTFDVLSKSNVSLAEYYVMAIVGYGIFLPPETLAWQSFKLGKGDPRGEVSTQEHLQAIFNCIENKWLEVIESERCKGDEVLEVGTIDFTTEGFALYREITNKIYGEGILLGYENLLTE
jgi:hypothetical protein